MQLSIYFHYFSDPSIAKKDLNALEVNFKLKLSSELAYKVKEQLLIDSTFLSDNNIIDYSMLFGIHRKAQGNLSKEKRTSVNTYLLSSYSSFAPRSAENVSEHKFQP